MVEKDPTGYVAVGQIGVVCDFDNTYGMCDVGIELEYDSGGNHNCNGRCRNRRGRYVPHQNIQVVAIDLGEIDAVTGAIDALYEILVR